MTDRFDSSRDIEVKNPRGSRVFIIAVLIVVAIVILIIVLIILLRKSTTTTSNGGTATLCTKDSDCNGTQVCNTSVGHCVDCMLDGDCPSTKPLCNTATNKCAVCLTSGDCPASRPLCDTILNQCVWCETDSDCGTGTPLCHPATKTCVACISGNDCGSSSPICNPANNFCVQCLTNADCTAPNTCQAGQCCDYTAPSLNGIQALINCPTLPGIRVNYTWLQNVNNGGTAIFEVYEHDGALIYTSPGVAVIGQYDILSPVQQSRNPVPPVFYAGYLYKVRMRLALPCGVTNWSNMLTITMPILFPPLTSGTPTIYAVEDVTTSTFNVRFNPPDCLDFVTSPFVMLFILPFTNGGLDLNLAPQALFNNVLAATCPPAGGQPSKINYSWPFPVASGQTYFLKAVFSFANCNAAAPGNIFPITIP